MTSKVKYAKAARLLGFQPALPHNGKDHNSGSAIDEQLLFQRLKPQEAFSPASLCQWIQHRDRCRLGITMTLSVSSGCARCDTDAVTLFRLHSSRASCEFEEK